MIKHCLVCALVERDAGRPTCAACGCADWGAAEPPAPAAPADPLAPAADPATPSDPPRPRRGAANR